MTTYNSDVDNNLLNTFNSVISNRITNDTINTAAQIAYGTVRERTSFSKTINDFVAGISYPIGVTITSSIAIYDLLSSGIKAKQRFTNSGTNEMLKYAIAETKKMRTDEQITNSGMCWYSNNMGHDKAKDAALYELFYMQTQMLILVNIFCNISTYFNDKEKDLIYSNNNKTVHTLMKAISTKSRIYVDKFYNDNK